MTNSTAQPSPPVANGRDDAEDLTRLPAAEMSRLVRSRVLDPVELVDATLTRIELLEPRLHAFTAVLHRSARQQAEALRDRADIDDLPLAGVPVAVKDNVEIAGEPTTLGSRATSSAPAGEDSALAVGSDGGGSIRVPAACCGVVGVKPAPGLVPLPGGIAEHWYGLTAFGPLARTVSDAALLLDVLAASHTYRDPVPATRQLRIGVSTRHPVLGVRPSREIRDALDKTATSLAAAGHQVAEAEPRYPMMPTQFSRRWLAGIAQDAAHLNMDKVEGRTEAMVRRGRRAQRKATPASQSKFAEYARDWFTRCDVLLTPVLSSPPVPMGKWRDKGWISTMLGVGRWTYTSMWNVAGAATVAVPAGMTSDGLPLGVQLIAPAGSEALLLSVAVQLERLNPWPLAPV